VEKIHTVSLLIGGYTLESGIDVGQGINVGPRKFGKKINKREASLEGRVRHVE
jgi:hypothetical protein